MIPILLSVSQSRSKNEEEQKEITKQMTKMDIDKQKHDMKAKQKVEWESPK